VSETPLIFYGNFLAKSAMSKTLLMPNSGVSDIADAVPADPFTFLTSQRIQH
jgi:hypothetical protein